MKTRTAILVAIVALLLLGSVVLRQGFDGLNPKAQGVALAQSGGQDPPAVYVVEKGTVSGGGYHLTSQAWQVSGTTSGGSYRLQGPVWPMLRGSGCCCTYLPLILRNYQ